MQTTSEQPSWLPLPRSVLGVHPQRQEVGGSCDDAVVNQRIKALFGDDHNHLQVGDLQVIVRQPDDGLPRLDVDESYTLTLTPTWAVLDAPSTWGALHGLTTLYQARSADLQGAWQVSDQPRFAWRGLMLDVARHFYSINCLKEVLDGMSLLKLNVLHVHLSDDQAFRFGSEVFPRLPSDECYSKAQLRELVSYAAARGIRVVPELDVPGHVTAWLAAYPEWGAHPAGDDLLPTVASKRFGVHRAALSPVRTEVMDALAALFVELADVFPDRYVHIGGDEVHPAWWQSDPAVQSYMSEQGLADARAVQADFNVRLQAAIGADKTLIGWDEVLHEQMPTVTVQNWRGATTRDRALAKGLDVIVSAPYYLDLFYPADMHYAADPELAQADWVALEDHWESDLRLAHVATGMRWTHQWRRDAQDFAAAQLGGRVLGAEACLWSELVAEDILPQRLWPRLAAVAERLWSSADVTAVDDFYRRADGLLALPQFNPLAVAQGLSRLGFAQPQQMLLGLLEPVKWYARLLGEQALNARIAGSEMPQARPYDTTTPLDRVVDHLPAESHAARAIARLPWPQLVSEAAIWQTALDHPWPDDVSAAMVALAAVGECVTAFAAGEVTQAQAEQALLSLYQPCGELMVAVIPPVLQRLAKGG